MTPDEQKPELRRRFRALRESLPTHEVAEASSKLCQRMAAWLPQIAPASPTLLTYLAFRNEIDMRLLFDLLPQARWAAPRIEGQRLAPRLVDPARLVRHRLGMLEPASDLPLVDPASLDLVLVPGVAFDRQGGRLGLGGGYYDRFLPTTPALRVGVTYDCCLVDRLPCAEHDQRMDWVATPTQIVQCAPRERAACTSS